MQTSKFIDKNEIQQIVQQIDIVALVGEFVSLKSSGKNFIGLCPFHQEKTPSFVVSSARQNYHCYGCGAHGDAIKFIMDIENYSFVDSIKMLAKRSGIKLSWKHDLQDKWKQSDDFSVCMNFANDFFRKNLSQSIDSSEVKKYLKLRGLKEESSVRFQLGYSPDSWTGLIDELGKRMVSKSVMESCGLIKTSQNGRWIDHLRDRLIFPIRNSNGILIGFAGRSLGDKKPKYLNPPDSKIYNKSSIFYGIFEGRDGIRSKSQVLLVEGYMDVIRLHEAGFQEGIATCGTALTELHLEFIKRKRIPKVVLVFDGDKAGQAAAMKASKLCILKELEGRVVTLPDQLDPDEFLQKHSKEEFICLIDKSPNFLKFLIQASNATEELSIQTEMEKIKDLMELYSDIKDPIRKDLFLTHISNYFSLNKSSLKEKYSQLNSNPKFIPQKQQVFRIQLSKKQKIESEILQHLLIYGKYVEKARKFLNPEEFSHVDLRSLYQRILQLEDHECAKLTPLDFADVFIEIKSLIMFLIQSADKHLSFEISELEKQNENDLMNRKLIKKVRILKKQNIDCAFFEINSDNPDVQRNLIQERRKLIDDLSLLNQQDNLTKVAPYERS